MIKYRIYLSADERDCKGSFESKEKLAEHLTQWQQQRNEKKSEPTGSSLTKMQESNPPNCSRQLNIYETVLT